MNKVEAVREWISNTALAVRYITHTDITHLLECGPGRIILNDRGFQLGQTSLGDTPELRHIVDWIVASLERGEEWLARVDEKGRPLKLMKCGTLDRLVHEADKAMRRWNAQIQGVSDDGAEIAFECTDGFKIYRLSTMNALDAESVRMGHCVGNGAYDAGVEAGSIDIYSLRDVSGKSHATVEVNRDRNRIIQVMGKANTRLKDQYMKKLVEWFNSDRTLLLNEVELPPAHPFDQTGRIIDLAALEPGSVFKGDLELRVFEDCAEYRPPIPPGLVVEGNLTIQAHRRNSHDAGVEEPYDFKPPVTRRDWGGAEETPGPRLIMPEGVKVYGKITVHGCRTDLPAEAWSYRLVGCLVESLPHEVDRSLELIECRILEPLGDIRFARNLVLDGCGEVEFGGRTEVNGEFTILRKAKGIAEPTYATFTGLGQIGGSIDVTDGELEAKDDLRVWGNFVMRQARLRVDGQMLVEGGFRTIDANIGRMPESLHVHGDMRLELTEIDRWPADFSVSGDFETGIGVVVRNRSAAPGPRL